MQMGFVLTMIIYRTPLLMVAEFVVRITRQTHCLLLK